MSHANNIYVKDYYPLSHDAPKGFNFINEFRPPREGEWFLSNTGTVLIGDRWDTVGGKRHILRKYPADKSLTCECGQLLEPLTIYTLCHDCLDGEILLTTERL